MQSQQWEEESERGGTDTDWQAALVKKEETQGERERPSQEKKKWEG